MAESTPVRTTGTTETTGTVRVAAHAGSTVPGGALVAAPAAAAPTRSTPKKKAKKAETLDELVKADTASWEEASDVVVPIDKIRLDQTATEGQIRTLTAERVDKLYAKMKKNMPTQRLKVVLWRTAKDGM